MRTRDDNKMESIYNKTLEMVEEEGFAGLSMQKLAKLAGVSPATIYIYFKDKEDLLLQLYKRECDIFFEFLLDGFDPEMDFATGLATQWRRRAAYILQHPVKAHFMEHFTFTPLHGKALKSRDGHFPQIMGQFVGKAIREKQLMPMPIEVYWSVAFGPLYSLVRFHKAGINMAGSKFELNDAMMNQTLALVLKALKPDPGYQATTDALKYC